MESQQHSVSNSPASGDSGFVEMPRATAAPLVLAAGLVLTAAGFVLGWAMVAVGAVLLFFGLGLWIAHLSSSRGHYHEALAIAAEQAKPVEGSQGDVEHLRIGMPGYRVQIPEKVHPISAGIKGALIGGLVMPVPALIYGHFSGHGIWFPVNLLAGMALPSVGRLSMEDLQNFSMTYTIAAIVIHAVTSLVAGLAYGVLLPMLPTIPKALAWGALLMPVLWTAASFTALSRMHSELAAEIDWPSFIFSQFVFGVAAALCVMRLKKLRLAYAGFVGGIVGGMLMVLPALLWAWFTGHSIWFPANVLSGMLVPSIAQSPTVDFDQFHADWVSYAITVHVAVSILFGTALGLLLPKLPSIPAPMSWGALLMPVVWTSLCYSLMDVVNPALHRHVEWPWFIVSQFIFGVVASMVVVRSEQIDLGPVGPGPRNTESSNHSEQGSSSIDS